jgi:hypothetical protein
VDRNGAKARFQNSKIGGSEENWKINDEDVKQVED